MHEWAENVHRVGDVRASDDKINEMPNKATILSRVFYWRSRINGEVVLLFHGKGCGFSTKPANFI